MFDKTKPHTEVTLSPDGDIHVEGQNFKGKSCLDAVKYILDMLGKVKFTKEKKERWQQNRVSSIFNRMGR